MKTLKVSKKELIDAILASNDFNSSSLIVDYNNDDSPETNEDGTLYTRIVNDMMIGNHHSIRFYQRIDVRNFSVDYSNFDFSEITKNEKWIHIDTYNTNCEEGDEIHIDCNYVKFNTDTNKYISVSEEEEDELYASALENHNDYVSDLVNEIEVFSYDGESTKYKVIYID